jgi:hypothetical protein
VTRREFGLAVIAMALVVIVQSIVHLAVVLGANRVDAVVDLDRSNGLPDLVSTLALASAAAGAAAIASRRGGTDRYIATALAATLSSLTVADLMHVGAHPRPIGGVLVIGLAGLAGVLVALVGLAAAWRARATFVVAFLVLLGSFLVNGLDQYDQWFERERGDPVREYEIVAKEGLELLGWYLVALALWDEALGLRRASRPGARAPASRGPAAPTRRAA